MTIATTPRKPASALNRYLSEFQLALADEIAAMRKGGGQKTYLSDGRYLGVRDNRYIYSFTADSELRFPDDTPVDIECQRRKCAGHIISIEGFDLLIAVSTDMGKSVATAILHSEPWFLLQKLQERLAGTCSAGSANQALALRLLSHNASAVPADVDAAVEHLLPARAFRGDTFRCNTDQLHAVGHVITNPISFIWGPPGTGKTSTLGMVVAALVEAGESVLVVAHSNVAVDVATESIASNLGYSDYYRRGAILRFGPPATTALANYPEVQVRGVVRRQNPQLIARLEELERERKRLHKRTRAEGLATTELQDLKDRIARIKTEMAPLREELKAKESELVKQAQVITCTLSKATIAPEVFERRFDAVIIDEASMAYIPHCVFVATLARQRAAVFGDFRQLAPIARDEGKWVRNWLQRDIFAEAGITGCVNAKRQDDRMVMLKVQHRMHSEIAGIVNRLFYGGHLRNGPGVDERAAATVAIAPATGHPLALVDLEHVQAYCYSEPESHSRFNLVSALFAAHAAQCGLTDRIAEVGIVTPYNAQSRLIRRILKDLDVSDDCVRVATVHRFQGSENKLIIFDTVDGEPKDKVGRLLVGGMDSTAMRLTNVAISRAQGKFVAVSNRAYLKQHLPAGDVISLFLNELRRHAHISAASWRQIGDERTLPGVTVHTMASDTAALIQRSLAAADEEVAIHWPARTTVGEFLPRALLRCDPARVRFFVTGAGSQAFHVGLQNAQIWETRSTLDLGLVGIDRRQLWVFLDPNDPATVILQLDLAQSVKLLYSFFGLVPDREFGRPDLLDMPCPQCRAPLWLTTGRFGAFFKCTGSNCGHTQKITAKAATEIARMMGIHCERCDGQVIGRRAGGGVFLGCTNYPACGWTRSLSDLV